MRKRETARWGIGKIYPDPSYFTVGEAVEGLNVIQLGNQFLDILIRDRNSSVTLVSFHASITVSSTYPVLVGDGITEESDVNLIAISDPSIALDARVRPGWFLGNRAIGTLRPILKLVIDTAAEALGTKRLIFFGNSGGGHAAIDHASINPGSIALTVNPKLSFTSHNAIRFSEYMEFCHPGLGRTAYQRVSKRFAKDLAETVELGANFTAAMYHNIQDTEYYDTYQRNFVERRKDDLTIYEQLKKDGEGHVPIPKERLVRIVRELSDMESTPKQAVKKAGFSSAK